MQSRRLLNAFLLGFTLLSAFVLNAQPIVDFDMRQGRANIANHLLLLEDSAASFDIEQVAEMPANAFLPYSSVLDKAPLNPKSAYWLRLDVNINGLNRDSLVFSLGTIDQATLFWQNPSGALEQSKGGWMIPKSERNFSEGDFTQAKFLLQLPANTPVSLYVRLEQPTKGKIALNPSLKSYIHWKADYGEKNTSFQMLMGLAVGLLGIMFFYNLFTGIFSEDKIYLYYSLYILGGVVYMINYSGLPYRGFLGEYPITYIYMRNLPASFGFVGYIMFIRLFLKVKDLYPVWDKILRALLLISVFNVLMVLVSIPISPNELFYRKLPALGLMLGQAFILAFIVRMFLVNDRLARYFAIGASFFSAGGVFLGYVVVTGAFSMETGLAVQVGGLAAELITFSLGLGYRIKLAEQEKRQAQEAMAKLLQEQNSVLERKVKERTREIEMKSEEIMTQNEELQQQHEEIISQRDYIEDQNRELIHKNEQITDSIRYAQTIQQTILPFKERMNSAFEDYFVFYKPKDMVSGDFYWFETVGKTKLLSVLDCTGHGVPGGFMSMMGFSILNDIALKERLTTPSQILDRLNITLIRMLQQEQGEDKIQDGMDVVLCAIDYLENEQVKVVFCGAKRPLYYVLPESNELQVVAGSRKSIGGHQVPGKTFDNHELIFPKGTILYLTTDGFADQHNLKGKKFSTPKLISLLSEMAHQPSSHQEEQLAVVLNEYMETQIQRDDITLMGVRL